MPGTKSAFVSGPTSATVYAIVKRLGDGYYLNDASGAFVTPAPADPYVALIEDAILKGVYAFSEARAAWSNGLHRIAFYKQAGGAPAPATDAPPLAVLDVAVLGDLIIDAFRSAADVTVAKTLTLGHKRALAKTAASVADLTDQVQIANAQGVGMEKDQRRSKPQ